MYKSLIYILFFFIFNVGFSQQDSLVVNYDKSSSIKIKKFDEEQIASYKKNSDFDYIIYDSGTSLISELKHWAKRILEKILAYILGAKKAIGVVAFIFKMVPYLVLAAIIVLLVRLFLKINTKKLSVNQTENTEVIFSEESDIIKNANIQDLIKKAIIQNNYRLAVRYYYLLVLQKLEEKEMIVWEQQKTNEDYIKEINHKTITKKFKDLTQLYDFVWYGNFEINELEFTQVVSNFNSLTTELK